MTDRPHGITPSQTVGPFFHYMLTPHAYDVAELFHYLDTLKDLGALV